MLEAALAQSSVPERAMLKDAKGFELERKGSWLEVPLDDLMMREPK